MMRHGIEICKVSRLRKVLLVFFSLELLICIRTPNYIRTGYIVLLKPKLWASYELLTDFHEQIVEFEEQC